MSDEQENGRRPTAGAVEERTAGIDVDGRKVRGVIPYGVESRDMGGWREVIEPTAFRDTKLDELRVTIDHRGVPLGRYPNTLDLEDRSDGLHWALDPPRSRSDVLEAIERGDMKAGSWRMRVAKDRWQGDVRHVEAIAELRDVCLVGAEEPAYPTAAVEYRTQTPPEERQEVTEVEQTTEAPAEERAAENQNTEDRTEERPLPAGSLRVDERAETVAGPRARGLADEFRARGFPGEVATIPWQAFEERAVTWSGSVDNIAKARGTASDLGYDQRYIWTVFPRQGIDAGVTSVDVPTQTARSLETSANTVRAIDAITNKPETASTVTIVTTAVKQVATVQSGIPNVYLESQAISRIVEQDLRLSLNDGLDSLVVAAFAASGFQAPGTDNALVSYRKAITTLRAAGYSPDTLVLTPAADEALDVMVSGITGGTADFVFAPGQFSSDTFFRMRRVVSKTVAAPVVVDSQAFGTFYAGPVSLARFEEAAGKTNTSLVRLETHAVFGVERQTAAVRIAAA
jgi:uncharacterized protein